MKTTKTLTTFVVLALLALTRFTLLTANAAPRHGSVLAGPHPDETQPRSIVPTGTVIVTPKFGGEILGHDIDRNGTEGLLSEFVTLSGGEFLVATETFSQKTGAILKVVAKENKTLMDDYDTQGIFGNIGLDLFQHAGQDHFLTINPLNGGKFTGNGRLRLRRTTNFGQSARARERRTSPPISCLSTRV